MSGRKDFVDLKSLKILRIFSTDFMVNLGYFDTHLIDSFHVKTNSGKTDSLKSENYGGLICVGEVEIKQV